MKSTCYKAIIAITQLANRQTRVNVINRDFAGASYKLAIKGILLLDELLIREFYTVLHYINFYGLLDTCSEEKNQYCWYI